MTTFRFAPIPALTALTVRRRLMLLLLMMVAGFVSPLSVAVAETDDATADEQAQWVPAFEAVAVRTLSAHSRGVQGLAWSADERWAISGAADRSAIVWHTDPQNPAHATVAATIPHDYGVSHVAISPTGEFAITVAIEIGTETSRSQAQLWRLAPTPAAPTKLTATVVARLDDGRETITDAAFSPDGRFLIAGLLGGSARVWRIVPATDATPAAASLVANLAVERMVTAVALTDSAEWALVGTRTETAAKSVQFWQIDSAANSAEMRVEFGSVPSVSQIAVARHAPAAGVSVVLVRSWESSQIECWAVRISPTSVSVGPTATVAVEAASARLDSTGTRMITTGEAGAMIWSIATTPGSVTFTRTAEIPHRRATAAVVAPSGAWALTASFDRTIKAWRLLAPPSTEPALVASAFVAAVKSGDAAGIWQLLDADSRAAFEAELTALTARVQRIPEANRHISPAGWAAGDTLADIPALDGCGFVGVFLRSRDGRHLAESWSSATMADPRLAPVPPADETARVAVAFPSAPHPLILVATPDGGWRVQFIP